MKVRLLFVAALFAAVPALAQFEVGGRYVLTMLRGDSAFAGGTLDVDSSQGFEACAELFVSPRVSARASAIFIQPATILFPAAPPPNDVDLGTLGINPITLTARWHFRPESRLQGYAGAGAAIVRFGNLDDQFGDEVEAELENETTFVGEAGVRYQAGAKVALEAGVTYMSLEATLDVRKTNVPLPETLKLDPLFLTMGVNWRF